MIVRASVRKVVHFLARVASNFSKLASGLRLFLMAVTFAPAAHAQVQATPHRAAR